MSKYVQYYNKNREAYRTLAEHWARRSKSVVMTNDEFRGITKLFRDVAVRFGLVTEFRELGVI